MTSQIYFEAILVKFSFSETTTKISFLMFWTFTTSFSERLNFTTSNQKVKIQAKNNKLGRLKAAKKFIRITEFLNEISYKLCNKKYWRTRKRLWYSHSRDFQFSKGQLISKCPYENQFHPKYQQKHFWISALKFFVASWGLPGSF